MSGTHIAGLPRMMQSSNSETRSRSFRRAQLEIVMSEQTTRLVSHLRRRLRHTARRVRRADLAFGFVVALGSATGIWLLATLLEANLWLGTTARTALAAAVFTVGLGISAAVLARPLGQWLGLLSGPSEEDIARAVGRHHPTVSDRLVNLLQLAAGKRSHAPAPLVDHAVQHLADDLDEVSFADVEDYGRARTALRLASLPLVGVLAFLLVAPSTFLNASERLLAPGTEFDRPAPFELSITPGNAQLVRGDTLQIAAQASGAAPSRARLLIRDTTGATEEIALEADSLGRFRHTVSNVRRPLQYQVVASPVRTPWHTVRVAARPQVRQLQLTVTPPAYTGRSPRTLDPNVGDVSALPGARVEIEATLGGADASVAVLDFDDGPADTLSVRNGTATGTFAIQREDTYRLRLRSPEGVPNRSPIRYRTSLRTDAAPSASFVSPDSPADLEPDLVQPLSVQLSDDFGFRRAALYYRMAEERFGDGQQEFSSVELPLPTPDQTSQTLTHKWLLAQDSNLDPQPGDEIEYYVQVWDNDTVKGPKSGRTRTQRLRMPSLSDQYQNLDKTGDEARQQLDTLQQRADATRKEFQQLRRELRRSREADWQDRRQLEQLQEKQAAARKEAEALSRTMDKMTQQMQKNELSSPQTAQQFQKLKRVAQEMSSPQMQKALDELKQTLSRDSSPRQRQQALEKAQQRQQQYQQQLERTDELFEQLKAQQQLEELSNRTQELSEVQDSLAERTSARMADSTGTAVDSARSASADSSRASPDRPAQTPEADTTSSNSPSQNESETATEQRSSENDALSREQERAAEEMEALLEKMEQARKEMEKVSTAPKEQMQQMQQQLQRDNMPEQMRKNSRQLRNNQLQKARQGQRQMQQQLQQAQQQLSKMQEGMQSKQQGINVRALRTALENTLHLSKEQETLRTTVDGLSEGGSALRPYARTQKSLADGLEMVTDSLESIARRSPSMTQAVQSETGQSLRAMNSAVTALDERDASAARRHQTTSMTHLNELALLLSDLLQQMKQQQQGSGQKMSMQQMMQQLQQTAGQQQKLNQQIQQQLNRAQGERLSGEPSEQQEKLARQQRQLKEQLQDMEAGSDSQQQIMGDLSKIQEQMEASARALEQNRRREDIRERQQQILTRLLNAQKSLQTQGKQQERRGQEAEGASPPRNPGDLPEPNDADKLQRDLIRSLEMGYTSEYENLIRRYFDLLEEEPSEQSSME